VEFVPLPSWIPSSFPLRLLRPLSCRFVELLIFFGKLVRGEVCGLGLVGCWLSVIFQSIPLKAVVRLPVSCDPQQKSSEPFLELDLPHNSTTGCHNEHYSALQYHARGAGGAVQGGTPPLVGRCTRATQAIDRPPTHRGRQHHDRSRSPETGSGRCQCTAVLTNRSPTSLKAR
jgi:hypothetical protein